MTPDKIELIQLARLPELRLDKTTIPHGTARRVMLAIAIETRNGEMPAPRRELARVVDLCSTSQLDKVISALVLVNAVLLGKRQARRAIGLVRAQALHVNWDQLRAWRREPLYRGTLVVDPAGVALHPATDWLLEARDRACARLDIGPALLGRMYNGLPAQELRRRHEARVAVYRAIQAESQRQGVRIALTQAAHLMGIDQTMLVNSVRQVERAEGAAA